MGTKEAISFSEEELNELEMIIVDEDSVEALEFLHRVIWKRIQQARRGRLKSHLDSRDADTVKAFHDVTSEK